MVWEVWIKYSSFTRFDFFLLISGTTWNNKIDLNGTDGYRLLSDPNQVFVLGSKLVVPKVYNRVQIIYLSMCTCIFSSKIATENFYFYLCRIKYKSSFGPMNIFFDLLKRFTPLTIYSHRTRTITNQPNFQFRNLFDIKSSKTL